MILHLGKLMNRSLHPFWNCANIEKLGEAGFGYVPLNQLRDLCQPQL